MNCLEAEQLFDAFLDDELSGALRLEFDAHRLRCRDCQQKLALLEACEHIFSRDARVPDLSDDFTERVMAQISDLGVRPRRSLPLRTLMTGAALLPAAAILLLAFVWPLGQNPRVTSDAKPSSGGDALARAMQDEIALYDYVAGGIEQLWAAKNALTADAEHLRLFAVNFTLSEDVTQAAFGARREPQPDAGDGSTRDEADESDVYSL
ncbi:MAG: zf-HC2 domain-containing protein [Planctomycetota bacterium]|nr:MAG: zf-HC2 domain-containing protein [Planctomycetota bacterium]